MLTRKGLALPKAASVAGLKLLVLLLLQLSPLISVPKVLILSNVAHIERDCSRARRT